MAVVLGIDSSTQSTKVEARDLDSGEVVATGRASHPPTSPPVSEQDPEAWWQALVEACAQLGPVAADVVAVAVGAQQHGLVVLGADDRPLRPAKLWNDTTSAANADALVAALGADRWAGGCGSLPVAAFTVAKLAWVAEHEPQTAAAIAKVMLPHDYLTWRLCGEHVTDRGDASGTGWFDPATGTYDADLVAAAGADLDPATALPRVLGPTEAAGTLTPAAAEALGLPAGAVVGPGTGDNMAAALGLGLRAGDVALSLGTSGTVYANSATPTADTSGHVAGFAGADGGFLPLVCTLNATKVTDTVAAWLGTDAPGLAALAQAAPQTVTGDGASPPPILVPYFDGERTPNLPAASGLFDGLRTTTTREALAKAAHDGVLCGLLDGVDALGRAGVTTDGRLVLIGGGARSIAYRQRAADLRGAPVLVPDSDETVATGAAVQAAAVHTAQSSDDVATHWHLGRGVTVDPEADDGPAVRAAYAVAAADVGARHQP